MYQRILQKRGANDCKNHQRSGRRVAKLCLLDVTGLIHSAMASYTRPVHHQVRTRKHNRQHAQHQHSRAKMGGAHHTATVTDELFAVAEVCEKQS